MEINNKIRRKGVRPNPIHKVHHHGLFKILSHRSPLGIGEKNFIIAHKRRDLAERYEKKGEITLLINKFPHLRSTSFHYVRRR